MLCRAQVSGSSATSVLLFTRKRQSSAVWFEAPRDGTSRCEDVTSMTWKADEEARHE
jgi:hypothetical protein